MSVASFGTAYSMELLERRLRVRVNLSPAERELLLTRNHGARTYAAGAGVRKAEDPALRATMIVSGWACREQISASGQRQLLSILVPGDLLWSGSEECPLDLLEVVAVSKLTVINVAGVLRTVRADPARYPAILRGLALLRFVEDEHLLEHVVRLGSQPAHQRVAGLLLELFERCRTIGFVTGGGFVMPLSQETFSNFAGLSLVHMSRILRRFKAECLIRLRCGMVEILDKSGLARVAEAPAAEPLYAATVHPRRIEQSALEMSAA